MNRALLFRRRLTTAGICVVCILFLAFYFAVRSTAQSEEMNHWVTHTQEVLGTIAQARLERAWMENECWGYRLTRDPRLQRQFQDDRCNLEEALNHLQQLTTDNAAQQDLLARLAQPISSYVSSLEEAIQQSAAASRTKHGGRVWADSQPGRGAAFYFTVQAYAKTRAPMREMVGANA